MNAYLSLASHTIVSYILGNLEMGIIYIFPYWCEYILVGVLLELLRLVLGHLGSVKRPVIRGRKSGRG